MCSIDDTDSDPLWVAFCRVPYRARSIRSIKADNKEKGKCELCVSCVMISLRLRARERCAAAYAGCDPRVGMKLFLLPAGAYRELIIPNYLESMYLAKLPKSLHPPNNIMRQLKMKLPHGRAGINPRASNTDTVAICPPYVLKCRSDALPESISTSSDRAPPLQRSSAFRFSRKSPRSDRNSHEAPFLDSDRVRGVPSR